MPRKPTQTHAHSQLPCWFSRTLHTHNKNHIIISTSGTPGFQALVDTPYCPASVSAVGIITVLNLTLSWTSRGGREGKTFNQNAELLPKGPVRKCAWNLAKSSRWWAKKGQDLIIWWLACSRWETQVGWGTSGEGQLPRPLPVLAPKVGKTQELMTWSSEARVSTYTQTESTEEWDLPSRANERRPHQVFSPMKTAMRHHEFRICDGSNRAWAKAFLTFFILLI